MDNRVMFATKKRLSLGLALTLLLITGCDLPGVATPTPTPTTQPTPTAIPTQAVLAPTLAPTVANLAPTALPPPTEIPVATAAPASTDPGSGLPTGGGPSMIINPAVGEPGEVTIVTGSGFVAAELIQFHWNAASSGAPTGPVVYEMNADGNGSFTVGLKIPPADQWPGGPPPERGLIQLRVTAPSLGFNWLFANFTFVKRFNPQPVVPTATPEPPTATSTP
jgi:hypothetical protein